MTSPTGGSSRLLIDASSTTPTTSTSTASSSFQPIPKKLQQIKTDKPRPHVCPVCTRGFARLEHLKRHERSHTNEKPFQCAACGRCFARRDLVLRHQQKLHLGLPIRNGKDENEHVIILDDNTAALAPLPHSRDQFTSLKIGGSNGRHDGLGDNSTHNSHSGVHDDSISSGVKQELKHRSDDVYGDPLSQDVVFDLPQFPTPQLLGVHGNSPPKQGSGESNNTKPVFRTPTGAFLNSHIPSPIPTSSSHNTPGRHPLITPDITNTNNGQTSSGNCGGATDSVTFGDYVDTHNQNRLRHNLYSAATAMLYLNNYDAGLIQNMQLPEVPLQVEFLTPQLNAVDEINYKSVNSVLNLATMNVDWNVELLNLNQNANLYYLMQFLDPQHPHHLKGMTPMVEMKFDFDKPVDEGKNGTNGVGTSAMSTLNTSNAAMASHETPHHRSSIVEGSQNIRHMSNSTHMSLGSEGNHNGGYNKKQRLLPDDFIRDIISTPFDGHFPAASHHIGFGNLPADSQQLDDILGLFRRRQLDLITGLSPSPLISENTIITEELRARILMESKLSELQFPPTVDLQNYMKLYEEEFDPCFPFVHLPMLKDPIVDNFDNIPLVLAMSTIGALYLFHDRNAILLFKILKLLLNQYFERELVGVTDTWKFKKVSITTHQCLVLHIFITIFINQDGMADTSARLISSMARLVHLTGFDKPLELLLVPPELLSTAAHDPNVIRKNYDYFIMAQLRIRTLHTFYLLQVFRAAVLGQPAPMLADALGSGLYCMEEEMWQCANLTQWFGMVSSSNKLNIISLSNSKSFSHLLIELHNHYTDLSIPLRTILSILFYVHQKIQGTLRHDAMQWRFQERPQLEALLKSWELMYLKAGGVLSVTASNQAILKKHKELRLILPSYYYAKLKLCVNVVPILQNVWSRTWDEMNTESFAILSQDPEALLEATQLAVNIINVWVHNISVANDAKSTSMRTPVFFVTVVFAAILVISHFLHQCEGKASLTAFERLLWLKCESIIRQSESVLSYDINSDKDKKSLLERDIVRREIQISGEVNAKVEKLKLAALSLEVGTRILTDAPVWPLAMRFADALKQRRNYVMSRASNKNQN